MRDLTLHATNSLPAVKAPTDQHLQLFEYLSVQ